MIDEVNAPFEACSWITARMIHSRDPWIYLKMALASQMGAPSQKRAYSQQSQLGTATDTRASVGQAAK